MMSVTHIRNTTWLAAVAAAPDLPPNALRVAVAVAANRSTDLAALVDRLGMTREAADAAVAALVASGLVRVRLEPTTPPDAPRPNHLSSAARRAAGVLADLAPPCHVETWRAAFLATMPQATPEARRQAWKRCRDALVAAGLVAIDEDGIVTTKEDAR